MHDRHQEGFLGQASIVLGRRAEHREGRQPGSRGHHELGKGLHHPVVRPVQPPDQLNGHHDRRGQKSSLAGLFDRAWTSVGKFDAAVHRFAPRIPRRRCAIRSCAHRDGAPVPHRLDSLPILRFGSAWRITSGRPERSLHRVFQASRSPRGCQMGAERGSLAVSYGICYADYQHIAVLCATLRIVSNGIADRWHLVRNSREVVFLSIWSNWFWWQLSGSLLSGCRWTGRRGVSRPSMRPARTTSASSLSGTIPRSM